MCADNWKKVNKQSKWTVHVIAYKIQHFFLKNKIQKPCQLHFTAVSKSVSYFYFLSAGHNWISTFWFQAFPLWPKVWRDTTYLLISYLPLCSSEHRLIVSFSKFEGKFWNCSSNAPPFSHQWGLAPTCNLLYIAHNQAGWLVLYARWECHP